MTMRPLNHLLRRHTGVSGNEFPKGRALGVSTASERL